MELKRLACAIEVKAIDDAGSFEGYGAVFNNVDQGLDIISPGAFTKSLASGRRVRMLWQHDPAHPIGVWQSLAEDSKGLLCKGQILTGVPCGASAFTLLKAGAIDGLSIGFRTLEDECDRVTGVRTLKAVDLYEVSVVTFPMNDRATVTAVKSAEEEKIDRLIEMVGGINLKEFNPREVEDALRHAGFSRRDAGRAIAIFRKHLRQPDDVRPTSGGAHAMDDPGDPVPAGDLAALGAALARASDALR